MPIRWYATPDQMIKAAARGLQKGVSKRVMEPSRTKYCPKNTGNLASTGEVLEPVFESSNVVRVTAQYTAPYAAPVHERNLNYKNGQWKYLSTPAYENADQVLTDVGSEVLQELAQ